MISRELPSLRHHFADARRPHEGKERLLIDNLFQLFHRRKKKGEKKRRGALGRNLPVRAEREREKERVRKVTDHMQPVAHMMSWKRWGNGTGKKRERERERNPSFTILLSTPP